MGPKQSIYRHGSAQGDVDNNTPPPGCFTIYEDSNYRGCKATRCANDIQENCSQSDNIGQCHQMPCADNCKMINSESECVGFSDRTSSNKNQTSNKNKKDKNQTSIN